ncbi:MAG TPA: hypothetical protein VKA51_11370 [Rubrobacteraceae bacterium]|nr:hypothetical protein [Rubrobacteraceae bacterium]
MGELGTAVEAEVDVVLVDGDVAEVLRYLLRADAVPQIGSDYLLKVERGYVTPRFISFQPDDLAF